MRHGENSAAKWKPDKGDDKEKKMWKVNRMKAQKEEEKERQKEEEEEEEEEEKEEEEKFGKISEGKWKKKSAKE